MNVKIYGISQCNTVKKARQWLQSYDVTVEFIDFKKSPPKKTDIEFWLTKIPKESLINRRGTTWRKLSETEQQIVLSNDNAAVELILAQPSIIKRPILVYKQQILVGFSVQRYAEFFTN